MPTADTLPVPLAAKAVKRIVDDLHRSSVQGYVVLDGEKPLSKAQLRSGRFGADTGLVPVPTNRWLAYQLVTAAQQAGVVLEDYRPYADRGTIANPLTPADIEKLTLLFGRDSSVLHDLRPALERAPAIDADTFRADYLTSKAPASRAALKPAGASKPAGHTTTTTVTGTVPDWVQKVTPGKTTEGPRPVNPGSRTSDVPVYLDEGDQLRVERIWQDTCAMADVLGWSPAELKREINANGFFIKQHEITALNDNRYARTTRPSLVMGLMQGIARMVQANAEGYEAAVAVSPPKTIIDPHQLIETAKQLRADIVEHYPNPHGLPSRER